MAPRGGGGGGRGKGRSSPYDLAKDIFFCLSVQKSVMYEYGIPVPQKDNFETTLLGQG